MVEALKEQTEPPKKVDEKKKGKDDKEKEKKNEMTEEDKKLEADLNMLVERLSVIFSLCNHCNCI